jgi:hypothetical protein
MLKFCLAGHATDEHLTLLWGGCLGVGGAQTTAMMLQEYPLDFAPSWAMGEASGQRDGNFPAERYAPEHTVSYLHIHLISW